MEKEIKLILKSYEKYLKKLYKQRDAVKNKASKIKDLLKKHHEEKHGAFFDGEIAGVETFIEELKDLINE